MVGRATQGVRLIKVKGDDSIAAVAKVMQDDDDDAIEDETLDIENGTSIDTTDEQTENNE